LPRVWYSHSNRLVAKSEESMKAAEMTRQMTQGGRNGVVQGHMPSILRRRGRVTCAECGASHPAVYKGQRCLICGSTIAAASRRRHHVETAGPESHVAPKNRKAEGRRRDKSAASKAEPARSTPTPAPSTPPARRDVVGAPEYGRYLKMAAQGMAERDNYPMPKSVTTPEMFYEVMARAALDAIDFRVLLGQLERANQQLRSSQETSRRSDTSAEDSGAGND
jgi:hypothetical protein